MRVYHVSDQAGIGVFEPRPSRKNGKALVWAVDEKKLPNYLLPRDCPRVTFHARPETSPDDIERFLDGLAEKHVIAVESAWFERIRTQTLHLYTFDADGFNLEDEIAGYYTREDTARPLSEQKIADPMTALLEHNVELRVIPSLWRLREKVINSTLGFSLIRMRNAQPPAEGYEAYSPLPG